MNSKIVVLSALFFILIYNVLFFHTFLGIGLGLLFVLLNLYFFVTRNSQNSNLPWALASSTIAILFAFLYAYRSSNIVQIINVLLALFFSSVAFVLYKFRGNLSWQIPEFLLLPFHSIKAFLSGMFRVFKKESWPVANGETISALLKGLVIVIPVLGILLILLTAADPIFSKFAQDFLSQVGERTVVSSILFIALLGVGISQFAEKICKDQEAIKVPGGKAHELSVVLGGILILFTVFILVQFRYLFSSTGERELAQLGINSLTYSEYVRKGFFELLISSVIACGVVVYSLRYLHHLPDKQKILIQFFSGLLTVETGFLLFSAAKRLALYADAHGLTRARIFGFIFLIWLAIFLTILLLRVVKQMKKEQVLTAVLLTTLLAFLSINTLNVDGLIATKYVPTVNKEVDYFYLTSLSPDAFGAWKSAVEDTKRTVEQLEKLEKLSAEDNRKLHWARSTMVQLYYNVQYLVDKYGSEAEVWDWQAFNLSEYDAYQEIIKDIKVYQQINGLFSRITKLELRVSDEVRENTPLDRSTQPPLL